MPPTDTYAIQCDGIPGAGYPLDKPAQNALEQAEALSGQWAAA